MLVGENIILRLAEEKDLETLYRLQTNIAAKGDYFPLSIRSFPEMQARFREGKMWSEDFKTFLIVEKESEKIVGTIIAFKPVFYLDMMELGYILHDVEARGKGYTAEAAKLFSDYLFRLLTITRVQIVTDMGNDASGKVAEKAGFTYECTLRHSRLEGFEPVDMKIYTLTRQDWESRRLKA